MKQAPTANTADEVQPDADEEIQLKQLIRRPHPAIKEIRDRPRRMPRFARRRALRIAHTLVTDALGRGTGGRRGRVIRTFEHR